MKIIAKISTDFSGKFVLPCQSGIAEGLEGSIAAGSGVKSEAVLLFHKYLPYFFEEEHSYS